MQQIGSDISPLIPAKHVLFVMDACFGGLLLSTRGAGLEPSHKLSYLEEITREQVRQIITAGGENEEVLDGGLYGHSVFIGRLLELLKNNKDYITAQELGLELEKKVYGDAMSRGHKQRPQVGKIYGTGDFVFLPDFEKLKKESEGEVSTLEAEMRELERLKQEAGKRKEDAKLREIERERLLKEAALKQARLREESARREDELRKKMEEESLKGAEEIKKQEKERGERLAYLKIQSEKMKQELGGSIASALGITEAQAEVKRLNAMIAKLEGDYQTELPKQLKPVRDYYKQKLKKAENQPPMDKMFETEAEYKERLEKAKKEVSSLKAELSQKETAITEQLKTDMTGQIKPFIEQRDSLTKQEFPVGNKEIKWKFGKYNPEKEEFNLNAGIKDMEIIASVVIPKAKAREYYQNPDLLVASAAINVSSNSSTEPLKFTLQGPEGDSYSARGIYSGRLVNNMVLYSNGTVKEFDTELMWQQEDDNIEKKWNDAISYCKGLSLGGYNDWRLPNISELQSIIDKTGGIPTINTTYFPNTNSSSYWSSTTPASYNPYAWHVSFYNGDVSDHGDKSNTYSVRCVRGGQ
jgi:hypothetical protein